MKRGHNRWRRRGMRRMAACVAALVMITGIGLVCGLGGSVAEDGVKTAAPEAVQPAAGTEAAVSEVTAALLYREEVPENALCIGVLPTEAGGRMKYYVPEEDVQKAIYEKISNMDVQKVGVLIPEWCRDAWDYNITVEYGEYQLQLKEGGVMLITRWQDTDFTEWVVKDEAVAAYIMDIAEKETGLTVFDNSSIQNIVKAELMTGPLYTGEAKESVVLTDPEKLAEIETLLSGAGKGFWSKCPFGNCRLVLTTAAGEEIDLAMACDSCTMFYADGCFYDYMPEEYRDSEDHPDNSIFFDVFGVSPEYFLNA